MDRKQRDEIIENRALILTLTAGLGLGTVIYAMMSETDRMNWRLFR